MVERRWRIDDLLGIDPGTLRCWIERVEVDARVRPGETSEERAELARLRKEDAELCQADDILETASAFCAAAELDRKRS